MPRQPWQLYQVTYKHSNYKYSKLCHNSPWILPLLFPQRGSADTEIKANYVPPLKPGVCQCKAMRALPAARNFFLVLISTFQGPYAWKRVLLPCR